VYHIGILQLTQNLDDAVHGFKQGLLELAIAAEFHYLNADGNLAELPKLADQLCKRKVDLIFACSTPAAQAAIQLASAIPVVFTPVFDPVGAGLIGSINAPGGKATGVAGMVKAADKVAFIRRLLPFAKNLGVLYHTGDTNAVLELKNFRQAAKPFFSLVELPMDKPEDLSNLPDVLPPDLDALFLPIGKIIEENFPSIIYYTDAVNLPIITSHAPNMTAGALGALVANHYKLGNGCAIKAQQILAGVLPGTIPVSMVDTPDILLNNFAAHNLGIELPITLLNEATEIFE
jgi:putative ABC transport system substrate-binding protein